MKARTLSGCCGVQEIYWFGANQRWGGDPTKEQIRVFLREKEQYLRGNEGELPSIMLVTLNNIQMDAFKLLFRKAGFKKIAGPLYHASHGNDIYILIKHLYPEGETDADLDF